MSEASVIFHIKKSLTAFHEEGVFPISEGTVSITGPVRGAAGATGAIAASVFVMAGCFIKTEFGCDAKEVENQKRIAYINAHPESTGGLCRYVSLIHRSII